MRYAVGQEASISKIFTEEDLRIFGEISLDNNPIHFDEEIASHSIFGKRIVHGLLTASLISAVLGTKLPGHGAIYISQSIKFTRPVYIGDIITAKVIVKEVKEHKQLIVLETICYNNSDKSVIEGEAVLKYST